MLSSKQQQQILVILFVIQLLIILYWYVGITVNVYDIALLGAFFEILWGPVIGATFMVPLIALYFWFKNRFKINSPFLLSVLLGIGTIFWLVYS